jgi:hypothetical protein
VIVLFLTVVYCCQVEIWIFVSAKKESTVKPATVATKERSTPIRLDCLLDTLVLFEFVTHERNVGHALRSHVTALYPDWQYVSYWLDGAYGQPSGTVFNR